MTINQIAIKDATETFNGADQPKMWDVEKGYGPDEALVNALTREGAAKHLRVDIEDLDAALVEYSSSWLAQWAYLCA